MTICNTYTTCEACKRHHNGKCVINHYDEETKRRTMGSKLKKEEVSE